MRIGKLPTSDTATAMLCILYRLAITMYYLFLYKSCTIFDELMYTMFACRRYAEETLCVPCKIKGVLIILLVMVVILICAGFNLTQSLLLNSRHTCQSA